MKQFGLKIDKLDLRLDSFEDQLSQNEKFDSQALIDQLKIEL